MVPSDVISFFTPLKVFLGDFFPFSNVKLYGQKMSYVLHILKHSEENVRFGVFQINWTDFMEEKKELDVTMSL